MNRSKIQALRVVHLRQLPQVALPFDPSPDLPSWPLYPILGDLQWSQVHRGALSMRSQENMATQGFFSQIDAQLSHHRTHLFRMGLEVSKFAATWPLPMGIDSEPCNREGRVCHLHRSPQLSSLHRHKGVSLHSPSLIPPQSAMESALNCHEGPPDTNTQGEDDTSFPFLSLIQTRVGFLKLFANSRFIINGR